MASYNKVDLDTKYANWNGWYNDLFEEIKIIRNIGGRMLLDPKSYMHQYYSGLLNLYSTHSSYIKNRKEVYKALEDIKGKIYSKSFNTQIRMKVISSDVIKVMNTMITIFTHINRSFQEHGIVPKVTITKERNPGKAMEESEY